MLNDLFNSTNQIADVIWIIQQVMLRAAHSLAVINQQLLAEIEATGWGPFLGNAALVLVVAALVEYLVGRRLRKLANAICLQQANSFFSRIGYVLSRTVFQLLCVLIFMITARGMLLLVTDRDSLSTKLLFSLLTGVVTYRLINILSQAIFEPHAKGIRPVPLACSQALSFHVVVMTFTVLYIIGFQGTDFLAWVGMDGELVRVLHIAFGLLLNLLVLGYFWLHRDMIGQMFHNPDARTQENTLSSVMAQSWPMVATLWLAMLWMLWSYNLVTGNVLKAEKIATPWWLTLLFPIIDRLFHAGLYKLCQLPWLQSHTFEQRSRRFRQVLQGGLRVLLITIALLSVADVLGYDAMAIGADSRVYMIGKSLLDSIVIVLFSYLIWEVVTSLIERHLPPPEEEQHSVSADEPGGAAGSRSETLLPPLRTLLSFVLVVIVMLSILHAMGVSIGPLLAGAGVAGIAIGLGAQKLVQDIISGIFFLLDDAFRRGEYIEAGNLRGTVERLSIRSMQLRHHLGALQTVPYSSISTVRNLSRDWVTMKLEMRLPYDVDLEVVRKTIKKVGEQMLADPEMGPSFILPLKSQGVMRIEESALIVRMKFTTVPGEQWVIRREAYSRVKKALEEQGISFAHRSVQVLMPPEIHRNQVPPATPQEEEDYAPPTPAPQAAAAASAAAVLAAELERQSRIDDEDMS